MKLFIFVLQNVSRKFFRQAKLLQEIGVSTYFAHYVKLTLRKYHTKDAFYVRSCWDHFKWLQEAEAGAAAVFSLVVFLWKRMTTKS